jgi:hypothetical protein
VITVGIDLAAEPKGTAVADIDWANGQGTLVSLALGASDQLIVEAASGAAKVGIDCALGWPDRFVDFLVGHRDYSHTVDGEFGAIN